MKKPPVKVFLVWVVLFTLFAAPAFAVKDDAIQSQHIAEADGTSGQDINLGDGVKTGHIQDGAVTDSKISAVSISKVTGLDDTLATKSDQAVVDAALSLKANQSDLDTTNTVVAGKADVGHSHFYGRMAVVATSGGEYSDPVAAMNDLGAWCGTPSSTNPCLLKILPGVYDVGTGSVNMSSYVDIEGSGRNTTVLLKGSAAATNDCVVRTTSARNSEIRMLTITRVGRGDALVSALYGTGNNITISDVSVVVTNGTSQAKAIVNNYGNITIKDVDVDSSQIAIDLSDNDNVEISDSHFDGRNSYASAYLQGRINDFASIRNSAFVNRQTGSFTRGLHIVFYPIPAATNGNEFEVVMQDSSVYAYRLAVLAVNGVNLHMSNMDIESSITAIEYSGASTMDISNSRLAGNIYYRFGGNLEIANTKLTGGFSASSGPGTVKCFGVYNANLAEVICP